MIIVEFKGGLGNQMFQYAFYEKLNQMGKNVKGDIVSFYHSVMNDSSGAYRNVTMRKFELELFPNICIEQAEAGIREKYERKARNIINRIVGKLIYYRRKVYRERNLNFDSNVYKLKDGYLSGYWQSPKYFADIRQVLLEKFTFPELEGDINKEYLKKIRESNSVSIHVRRGDYLTQENKRLFGDICTLEYYGKAIQYFEHKYQDVVFFVFSNDIEWAKENLKMRRAIIVEGNEKENAYKDMYLMTQCKHNIIANSSFSWWGAWLNQNPNQEVIAPSKWINIEDVKDIWCENWMKMEKI